MRKKVAHNDQKSLETAYLIAIATTTTAGTDSNLIAITSRGSLNEEYVRKNLLLSC